MFSSSDDIRLIVAVIEYFFIAIAVIANPRVGLMYYLAFTLLAMGVWSYVDGTVPSSFWGVRLFGFSVNVFFTAVLCVVCFASPQLREHSRIRRARAGLLGAFIAYSALVGLLAVTLSVNYVDSFLNDAFVYLPFFAYTYLVSRLDRTEVLQVVRHGLSLTIFAMVLSYATDNLFQYQEGFRFVLMNSFAFIVVFTIFFVRRLYSLPFYIMMLAAVAFLLATGSIFLGGKGLIILAAALTWGVMTSNRSVIVISVVVLVGSFVWDPILQTVSGSVSDEGGLLSYKFSQILDISLLGDIDALSATTTSMGNLAAEARTILGYLATSPMALLFGKGFGAGVPDVFGYLRPFVGPGAGYSEQSLMRNDFVRLHLPIFEITLKAGVLGLILYLSLVAKIIRRANIFAFVSAVLLLTVFSNSKESLLLTCLFMALANDESARDYLTHIERPERQLLVSSLTSDGYRPRDLWSTPKRAHTS